MNIIGWAAGVFCVVLNHMAEGIYVAYPDFVKKNTNLGPLVIEMFRTFDYIANLTSSTDSIWRFVSRLVGSPCRLFGSLLRLADGRGH